MLTIRKAQKAGDTAPRLQDVTRLTFVSPKNDRYDLLPGRVPRSIFSILNARKKLTACFSDMRISCVLKFSEDLWLFRSFCTVRVNGRNLGYDVMAEGMKDIPVHEMDLMHIRGMIRKRNDALLKLQEERKQLNALTRQFDTLLAAGTASQNKLNRLLPGRRKELRQLSAALLKDDKDTAEKIMDELSHDLLRKVKEEKIKAKDKNDFEAELEEFRKISGDSAAADAQRKKCQERLKKAEQDFSRHDGNLRNDLKNLSPALYRLGCKVMTVGAEHKVLPLEFYRQISEAELLKDIQVEIIRKERP
jgi:hypothetical protein